MKDADKQTRTQSHTDTSTDNKDRLKPAAREPIMIFCFDF